MEYFIHTDKSRSTIFKGLNSQQEFSSHKRSFPITQLSSRTPGLNNNILIKFIVHQCMFQVTLCHSNKGHWSTIWSGGIWPKNISPSSRWCVIRAGEDSYSDPRHNYIYYFSNIECSILQADIYLNTGGRDKRRTIILKDVRNLLWQSHKQVWKMCVIFWKLLSACMHLLDVI